MKLKKDEVDKIKEFAVARHVNFNALKEMMEDIGCYFPKERGKGVGEKYRHIHKDYRYITMIHPETHELALWNLDSTFSKEGGHWSDLAISSNALVEGWKIEGESLHSSSFFHMIGV